MEAVEGQFDLQKIQALLMNLGAGGAIGIITGAALKHTAKRVAIALGTVFIFLQVFQFFGFVDVRWDKISSTALPYLDVNGDKKLDEDDARIILDNMVAVIPVIISQGLPNLAGFASGLVIAAWFL